MDHLRRIHILTAGCSYSNRLGTFHNALPNAKQDAMKQWAAKKYPAVWADLQNLSKRNKMSSAGNFTGGILYNIHTDIRA